MKPKLNPIATRSRALAAATCLLMGVADAALIAHYKFDETSGTTAHDELGGTNATISGGVTINQTGVSGGAYAFDGVNSTVGADAVSGNLAIGDAILASGAFSFSAWFKTSAVLPDNNRDDLVTIGSATVDRYYIDMNVRNPAGGTADSFVNVYTRNGTTTFPQLDGTSAVNDGTWNHAVCTLDSDGTSTIYVNGSLETTGNPSFVLPAIMDRLRIGSLARPTPASLFTGLIDDVQIYDQALTASEVSFLFNNPGQSVPEPSTSAMLGLLGGLALRRRRKRA